MCISAATMMALSAGMSAAGMLVQGAAANRAGNAQAAIDAQQAAQQKDAAEQEAARVRKAADRTRGAARAQMAASGIRVDSGSALLIDEEITRDSESDAMELLLTGKRRSDSLMTSARNSISAGRGAMAGSVLGAVGTGLQGWKGVKAAQALDPQPGLTTGDFARMDRRAF